jgi:glutamine amidotransferase
VSAVGVVDLGTGNIFSVLRGLERAGGVPVLVSDPASIARASRIVLPGVGAFADAAQRAHAMGLASVMRDVVSRGTPVLGICLGMQLLFEEGEEDGPTRGLGLLKGRVTKLVGGPRLTVPHVGWQPLEVRAPCALLPDASAKPWFYFSHSYRAQADASDVSAFALHGEEIPAVVAQGSLFGIQPHPEKSGPAGHVFLQRFLALEGRAS